MDEQTILAFPHTYMSKTPVFDSYDSYDIVAIYVYMYVRYMYITIWAVHTSP